MLDMLLAFMELDTRASEMLILICWTEECPICQCLQCPCSLQCWLCWCLWCWILRKRDADAQFLNAGVYGAYGYAAPHGVAATPFGLTHSSNVGICHNFVGAQVPC